MIKSSIAVYNPSDPLERALQDASFEYLQEWMPAYVCKLMAKAITRLKCFTDFTEADALLKVRNAYFFLPEMIQHKEQIVFPVRTLFLRDILENAEINQTLHHPITFVTRPIAHYLLREYPIHLYIDQSFLRHLNPNIDFVEVGGLIIADEGNVKIDRRVLLRIRTLDPLFQPLVDRLESQFGMTKSAATELQPDVFFIDEHERILRADEVVTSKDDKRKFRVTTVEPGETGLVHVVDESNNVMSVPKIDFERYFYLA